MFECKICKKEFKKEISMNAHIPSHYRNKMDIERYNLSNYKRKEKKYNNGNKICKFCGIEFNNGYSLGSHIPRCIKNPKLLENIEKFKKGGEKWKGKLHSENTRKNLSEKMKLAHKEGRAWNIGKSRWNNKKSYPEEFFEKCILNEFEDKNYKTEYPLDIYSLDFAWPHKKKAIEIDGEQHIRYKEYQDRDKKKDQKGEELGWCILRIEWKTFYSNTKEVLGLANKFIGDELKKEYFDSYLASLKPSKIDKTDLLEKKELNKRRVELIKNSDIDFSKFGWVNEVSKIINIRHQKVNKWMKNNMMNFYLEKCYKKK